jgi:hypothetical protein
MGMPVRQRLQHLLFYFGERLGHAELNPGQQPWLRWIRQQVDDGDQPERPNSKPQREQRGTAADHHFPALRVYAQLPVGVSVQFDRVLMNPESPRLRILR